VTACFYRGDNLGDIKTQEYSSATALYQVIKEGTNISLLGVGKPIVSFGVLDFYPFISL
jgi:hypothetical protein